MGWPSPTHEAVVRRRKFIEAKHLMTCAAAALATATSPFERSRAMRHLRKQAEKAFAAHLSLIKARRAILTSHTLVQPVSCAVEEELAALIRQEQALHQAGVDGIIQESLNLGQS